jgi:cell division protein FtsB
VASYYNESSPETGFSDWGTPEEGRSALSNFLSSLTGKILWLGFFVGITFGVGYYLFSKDVLTRNSALMEKRIMLEEENLRLEEENRQLEARLDRLQNDPGYLEDEARKKLGLVRPDEVIFRLADEPELTDEDIREQLN